MSSREIFFFFFIFFLFRFLYFYFFSSLFILFFFFGWLSSNYTNIYTMSASAPVLNVSLSIYARGRWFENWGSEWPRTSADQIAMVIYNATIFVLFFGSLAFSCFFFFIFMGKNSETTNGGDATLSNEMIIPLDTLLFDHQFLVSVFNFSPITHSSIWLCW